VIQGHIMGLLWDILKYERGWKEKAKRRKEIRVGAHGSSIDVKLDNNNQSLNLIARKENKKVTF